MTDPWAPSGYSEEEVINGVIARWRQYRASSSANVANKRFHSSLFGDVADATAGDLQGHALALFRFAWGIDRRGMVDDAFLILRWIGQHYAGHADPDIAVRVIMALTDDCFVLGCRDPERNAAARRVLRAVVDDVHKPSSVEVERALARLLVHLAGLWGEPVAEEPRRAERLLPLWKEISDRWRDSPDPELRRRAAQGLTNQALIALTLRNDEQLARRAFAEIVRRFSNEPPDPDGNLEVAVTIARHAPAILDRLAIDGPEFQLAHLRRRRLWKFRHPVNALTARLWRRGSYLTDVVATINKEPGEPLSLRGLEDTITALRVSGPAKSADTERTRSKQVGDDSVLDSVIALGVGGSRSSPVKLAREMHFRSVGLVRRWSCFGEPFVLLLRKFRIDRAHRSDARRHGAGVGRGMGKSGPSYRLPTGHGASHDRACRTCADGSGGEHDSGRA